MSCNTSRISNSKIRLHKWLRLMPWLTRWKSIRNTKRVKRSKTNFALKIVTSIISILTSLVKGLAKAHMLWSVWGYTSYSIRR